MRVLHLSRMGFGVLLAVVLLPRPAVGQVASFGFNGHAYFLYGSVDARTWPNAMTFATSLSFQGQPGYLTRIDTAAENAQLFSVILANQASLTNVSPDGGGGRYVWIGGNDIAVEGAWRWHDNNAQFWSGGPNGSPVGGLYNNWGTLAGQTEPDNFPAGPAGQDAAGLSVNGWPLGSAGQWNDIVTTNTMPFIVEFNAVPEPAGILVVSAVVLFAIGRGRR